MSGAFGKSSDRKLVERIANADKAAVQALFARYHLRIYRFVLRMVEDQSAAEDLTNEVFLQVWRQAGRFESRLAVSTWLMAIARSRAVAYLNKEKTTPTSDEEDRENVGKGGPIQAAIRLLSPDHRAVIDLAYYHELSIREVAKVLDLPAKTVKIRMTRAREKLAKILDLGGTDRGWP